MVGAEAAGGVTGLLFIWGIRMLRELSLSSPLGRDDGLEKCLVMVSLKTISNGISVDGQDSQRTAHCLGGAMVAMRLVSHLNQAL